MTKVRAIYRLDDLLEHIYKRHSGNIKYDLDRIHKVLEVMGHPERNLRGIHTAGTNGKGSTSAIFEAISLKHKWTTGLNTSPHLIDYRERFRINGKNITTRELLGVYRIWSDLFEETESSFFEITTAIAFYYFQKLGLHTSIFEVGLGGRLDATNPFNATVSIITSIAIDHPKTLGDSLEKIAFEKAGIIKERVPLILGNLPDPASKVILEVADKKRAPVIACGKDFFADNIQINNEGTRFDLIIINKGNKLSIPEKLTGLQTNLIGRHQAHNAALALIAYTVYCEKLGEKPDWDLARAGLKRVKWQGRMQIIDQKPLTILDCAHNEEGISKLVENLQQLFPDKSFRIVTAILRDKHIEPMITMLSSIASKLYISKNHSERAADIDEQIEVARKCAIPYSKEPDIISALEQARKESNVNEIVIVTGSIYTVSEIIMQLER